MNEELQRLFELPPGDKPANFDVPRGVYVLDEWRRITMGMLRENVSRERFN